MPRISLCVPTYNRASFLRHCVSTLLNQTSRDFEVVVVDNCSSDGTVDVADEFSGDARFRFVRNAKNVGPQENCNRCVEVARGDYIAICHDDDFYAPAYAETCSGFLDLHPSVGFVHCGHTITDVAGRPLRHYLAYPADRVIPARDSFLSFLRDSHNVLFPSVMARRTAYEAVGRFRDGFVCADYDMWLRMSLRYDVGFLSHLLVYYRTHDDTISRKVPITRSHEEHVVIIEDAIALAEGAMPFLTSQRKDILDRARAFWARRGLREGLSRMSYGNISGAQECLRAADSLAVAPRLRLQIRLAQLLLSPLGIAFLGSLRPAWQYLQRLRNAERNTPVENLTKDRA